MNVLPDFRAALAAGGVETTVPLVPDGVLRRVYVVGDRPGTKNGWYVLYGDGVPSGSGGSWKSGVTVRWRAGADRVLSRAETELHERRVRAARAARDAEWARARSAARARAESIWRSLPEAGPVHPYLRRKAVAPHGVRAQGLALVVPVRDHVGTLHGLQFIHADGGKRFLRDTVKVGCFHLIGHPGQVVAVAEGYATAASVHEVTGWLVAVAFDSGNLVSVARNLRLAQRAARLIICADNDSGQLGNPGLTAGRLAADTVGGLMLYPRFGEASGSDWNDFVQRFGRPAARRVLLDAVNPP